MSYLASKLSNSGVDKGSGPSSKVIATALFPDFPRQITGRKKPKRGKKGATMHNSRKHAKGIMDSRTSRNNSRIDITYEPKPTISATEKEKRAAS